MEMSHQQEADSSVTGYAKPNAKRARLPISHIWYPEEPRFTFIQRHSQKNDQKNLHDLKIIINFAFATEKSPLLYIITIAQVAEW